MRAREFIVESTLGSVSPSSWPGYLKYLIGSADIALGARGEQEQGLELDAASKRLLQKLKAEIESRPNDIALGKNISKTTVKFTSGASATVSQIYKSPEMKGQTFEVRSRGLIAEALLGVAMYAKLINRGGDFVQPISTDDIWKIIDGIKPTGDDTIRDSVHDINNKVSDSINLDVYLPSDVQQVLTDPAVRPLLTGETRAVVAYVNDKLAQRYADVLYRNNRPDSIHVRLSGKEGGKVDVEINVLNDQGESTRKMEQVKLSVKLSSSLIGQKARGKTAQEVYTNLQELFEPLSVDLESVKKQIINLAEKNGVENQFADAVTLAYKTAYEQLRSLTTNRAEDIVLVQRLGKFLDYHATQHDPEIQVIQLDSAGTYKILSYRKLDTVMRDESINIAIRMNEGSSDKYPGYSFPNITFYDSTVRGAKGILMEIRYRTRGSYANHIVQPGPVLKELATYRRYKTGKQD
jgi:hypothetical protein